MRILHTADWHLGKRLEEISRLDEQRQVMEEICRIAEDNEVDVVLISGDIFDHFNPAVEAEKLFLNTVYRLSANGRRAVVAIAGNHDSPDRISLPDELASQCGIILAGHPHYCATCATYAGGIQVSRSASGFVEICLPGGELLRILLAPYANELRLRTFLEKDGDEAAELRLLLQNNWQALAMEYCDDKGINILAGHLLMTAQGEASPEEPEGERSVLLVGGAQAIYTANLPEKLHYAAFGHLHRYQHIKGRGYPVVYSGSPLAYSMSEAGQQKYVVLLDASCNEEVNMRTVPLHSGYKLHRKRFTRVDEAVEWLTNNADTIVELTMETETYLSPEERRALARAHSRIIGPIPVVNNPATPNESPQIDLSQEIGELFKAYFKSRNGQQPGEDIMSVFKEILEEGPSEDPLFQQGQ